MVINALPDSTIHLLHSSQVLTTPASLVKELIDNALDARASSIDVLIAPNTLDKIEVRDNGHGILFDDLISLGRRGHTSKLRCFEDLKYLGGTTLGFRGEALASAVQLGEVSVITRSEGEVVAMKVKLQASGGYSEKSPTAQPVGTTISVAKFMHKIPVRKKTFEKESAKSLAKIRQMMQAFALARPSVRFSFKVSKTSKDSWSFSPRVNDGIKDAVAKVLGRDVALQCIEKMLNFSESNIDIQECQDSIKDGNKHDGRAEEPNFTSRVDNSQTRDRHDIFVLEAFLPKPGFDPVKIGKGQYLSIDSRPVSHEKGTMKKMVAIFKAYLRASTRDGLERSKNPFIRLNLKCPKASYDPNVEPAKDDVLFGNETLILSSLEQLLKVVYGEQGRVQTVPSVPIEKAIDFQEVIRSRLPPKPSELTPASLIQAVEPHSDTAFDNDYASVHPRELADEKNVRTDAGLICNETPKTKTRKWEFQMSSDFTEDLQESESHRLRSDLEIANQRCRDEDDPGSDSESISNSNLNPWTIAKMTAPMNHGPGNSSKRTITTSRTPQSCLQPTATWSPGVSGEELLLQPLDNSLRRPAVANLIHGQYLPNMDKQVPPSLREDELFVAEGHQETRERRRNDFVNARDIPDGVLMTPPQTLLKKAHKRPINTLSGPKKPFVSPMTTVATRASETRTHQTALGQTRLPFEAGDMQRDGSRHLVNPELPLAMDYEHRKVELTRRLRKELREAARTRTNSTPDVEKEKSSPHKNRYNTAIAALECEENSVTEVSQNTKLPFETSLLEDDPRVYLMKRKKSMAARILPPGEEPRLRAKSMKLPLETIRIESRLHSISQRLKSDACKIARLGEILSIDDVYIHYGRLSTDPPFDDAEVVALKSKTEVVVSAWLAKQDESHQYQVEYDFAKLPNVSDPTHHDRCDI